MSERNAPNCGGADVVALGGFFVAMLCDSRPFTAMFEGENVEMHRHEKPSTVSLDEMGVPRQNIDLVQTHPAKSPSGRQGGSRRRLRTISCETLKTA